MISWRLHPGFPHTVHISCPETVDGVGGVLSNCFVFFNYVGYISTNLLMDINHNEGLIVDFYSYWCLFSLHYTCDVVQTFIYSETAHQANATRSVRHFGPNWIYLIDYLTDCHEILYFHGSQTTYAHHFGDSVTIPLWGWHLWSWQLLHVLPWNLVLTHVLLRRNSQNSLCRSQNFSSSAFIRLKYVN